MPIVFDKLLGRPLMHSHGSSGIENGAITLIKMADMASASLIYRKTAGAGVPEVNTLATLKTDLVLVKADVGLGNVDNTTDAGKPVSTATQTELDLKSPLATPVFTTQITTPLIVGTASLALKPTTNATTAIQLQNAAGTSVLNVDTTNGRVGIGTTTPNQLLSVANLFTVSSTGAVVAGVGVSSGYSLTTEGRDVNYNGYSATGSYYTYQAFGSWHAYGSDIPAGTKLAIGGFRASQWDAVTLHTSGNERVRIDTSGNVGIGTTTPSSILAFGGNSARVVSLERHTTANTLGSNLSLVSGGATVGATDKNGGNLLLNSGIATGTGFSSVKLQAVTAGGTGTTDRTVTTHFEVGNSKIAFYGSTPVVKATALTAIDASALNTGDATSDTVIGNMRTRINELETKLQAYGLLT